MQALTSSAGEADDDIHTLTLYFRQNVIDSLFLIDTPRNSHINDWVPR